MGYSKHAMKRDTEIGTAQQTPKITAARDPIERKQQVQEMLDLSVENKIQLSAYWAFDSPDRDISIFNVAPQNENEFVLDQIAEATRRSSS